MKATVKNIQSLAASLKKDFGSGLHKGSFSERLEKVVLGYENAFRSDEGLVGITTKHGNKYLWIDINV